MHEKAFDADEYNVNRTVTTTEEGMAMANAATHAPTQFIQTKLEKYAYPALERTGLRYCVFNTSPGPWTIGPAVTDPLALERE